MVQVYGIKTRSVRKYRSEKLESPKLRISVTLVGVAMFLIGLFFDKIKIFFEGEPIEQYIFAILVVSVSVIQFLDLGVKRWTDFSKLKGFSNQQFFTFWTTVISVVLAIVNVMGYIDSFGWFANGIIATQGALLILEANR